MKLKYEPARIAAAVTALLGLAVGYGLLTTERAGLWGGAFVALLAIVQGEVTRSQAVPLAKIEDAGLEVKDINVAAKANTDGAP